jgi:hypothetical protein
MPKNPVNIKPFQKSDFHDISCRINFIHIIFRLHNIAILRTNANQKKLPSYFAQNKNAPFPAFLDGSGRFSALTHNLTLGINSHPMGV